MKKNGYTVLLDGYNIIKRNDNIFSKDLRGNRELLRNMVFGVKLPFPVKQMLIVYDANKQDQVFGMPFSNSLIKEVYARNTADTYIRKYVKTEEKPEKLIVVSNDKEILSTAKSFCAGSMDVDEFLSKTALERAKIRKPVLSGKTTKKKLSQKQQKDLEAELRQAWGIE